MRLKEVKYRGMRRVRKRNYAIERQSGKEQ